jgi:hypothetical protein
MPQNTGFPFSEALKTPGVYWVLHRHSTTTIFRVEVLPHTLTERTSVIVNDAPPRTLHFDMPEWKEDWLAFDNYWFAYAASIKWKAQHTKEAS